MPAKRALTHQKNPDLARLKDEAQVNLDDAERRVKRLEAQVAKLERLADYIRGEQYTSIAAAFAAIPSPIPGEPPT